MRTTLAVSVALLLSGAAYLPAHAQMTSQGSPDVRKPVQGPSYGGMQTPSQTRSRVPQGSFQSTCRDARMAGQTLIAFFLSEGRRKLANLGNRAGQPVRRRPPECQRPVDL